MPESEARRRAGPASAPFAHGTRRAGIEQRRVATLGRGVQSEKRPISQARIERDLAALGVEPGATLVVHSSLRAIGWVIGGPQ